VGRERATTEQASASADSTSDRWTFKRVAAVCALVGVATLVAALIITSGSGGYHYRLLFQTAGQLVPGNQVYIGGVPVGSVDSISLADDSTAQVDVSVNQELHQGSTATVRATSLSGIANHYVSISPGPNNAPALGQGETIGLAQTTSPVELDALFNAFKPNVRQGLRNFIQGNAAIYAGVGPQANQTYRYFAPALGAAERWMEEIGRDQPALERFVVNSSALVTAISQRAPQMADAITNAHETFGAIAEHTASLDQALAELPGTFRQGNTTFHNLRAALDDIDPLVATAKPATKNLAPFLGRLRPVVKASVPVFTDLGLSVNRPGKPNDAPEILKALPATEGRASVAFPHGVGAIHAFQPTLDFARPYMPDVMQSLAKLGADSGYYDANGHYFRVLAADGNLTNWNSATHVLDPIPIAHQFDQYGPPHVFVRCPGSATQPAADASNPFAPPVWPQSGLTSGQCNPSDVPPGP
jgi:phospholipid/cholesterol/gamma-HCH transport system substrate-binding protein